MKNKKRKGFISVGKKQYEQLLSDYEDMRLAYKTIFYRCKCGRIREEGIICPDINCKIDN